jgi:hypothetical protein
MKTLKTFFSSLAIAALLFALPARAQIATITSTTLSAAITDTKTTTFSVASATDFVVNNLAVMDNEVRRITAVSGTLITATRGANGGQPPTPHVSGTAVYVGPAVRFGNIAKSGACTLANEYSPTFDIRNGDRYLCTDGQWGKLGVFRVLPTSCTFAPTTLTTTNTYIQVGASNAFVLNGVSNAAAGTQTLVCDFLPPTEVTTGRGAILTDIVVALGSQVVAPTSLGTSTLGTVTFPTPVATTQTASVVTPVAVGGTVTTVGPTTTVQTVTTAGAFLTFSHNYATPVELNTDLQLLHYTFPILQSAASAMTLNTPGLWVHYQKR